MKGNNSLVIWSLVILLLATGVFAYFNYQQVAQAGTKEGKILLVQQKGEEKAQLSLEQIKKLNSIEVKVTLRSSGAPPSQHTFQGVPLVKLLDKYLGSKSNWQEIVVRAEDGYTVSLNKDEITKDTILAYAQDGKDLADKKNGEDGPLRLIIPEDKFGQRWCRYVNKLEAN